MDLNFDQSLDLVWNNRSAHFAASSPAIGESKWIRSRPQSTILMVDTLSANNYNNNKNNNNNGNKNNNSKCLLTTPPRTKITLPLLGPQQQHEMLTTMHQQPLKVSSMSSAWDNEGKIDDNGDTFVTKLISRPRTPPSYAEYITWRQKSRLLQQSEEEKDEEEKVIPVPPPMENEGEDDDGQQRNEEEPVDSFHSSLPPFLREHKGRRWRGRKVEQKWNGQRRWMQSIPAAERNFLIDKLLLQSTAPASGEVEEAIGGGGENDEDGGQQRQARVTTIAITPPTIDDHHCCYSGLNRRSHSNSDDPSGNGRILMVGAQQGQQEMDLDESEQQRYRQVLEGFTFRNTAKSSTTANGAEHRLPPSMLAAAQHLERQSKSLAALSLNSSDSGAKSPLALSADHQMNGGNLVRIRRRIIAPSAQNLAESENQRIEEKGEEIGKNKPPKVPTKPAIREAPQHSLTDTSSLNARRRCVQFSAIQNNENVSLEIPAEDDGGERGEEESEPRVQIVGAQEVYMNDPRERRLQELQANQKVIRPVVDSSSLGFREKMRIFAEQLGEQKLPAFGNQHKSSSAERRIAQIGQNEGEKAEEEEEKNIGKHRE